MASADSSIAGRTWRRIIRLGESNPLFILPALAIYVVVILVPILMGAGYAFTNWDGLRRTVVYVGVANFSRMLGDIQVRSAIGTTLLIAFSLVVVKVTFGLVLALVLNGNLRARKFLRIVFFMPVVLTPIIVSYMWKYMFSNDGTLNTVLRLFGFEGLRWLGDPTLALVSVIIVTSWQSVGLSMVIFLAGLQAVPPELEEAAMIDGAGPLRRIWHVTLPLLAPAVTVCVVIALIQGLRFFDQIYALTRGGPGYATETLSTMIYRISFQFGEFSYGAAVALVFSFIVAVIVLPVMQVLRRREIVHG
jgi:raffinose/stachyose/melibiose transport system permease protein